MPSSDGVPLLPALEDPEARQLHLDLLPPAPPEKDPIHEHHLQGLELKPMYAGSRALTTSEKTELLLSADSIRRLRPETAAKVNPTAGVARRPRCRFDRSEAEAL